MTHLGLGISAWLIVGMASAAEPSPGAPRSAVQADACQYQSHDWSVMHGILTKIVRLRHADAEVQQIVKAALAGSAQFSIGEFKLQYATGSADDGAVCYPKQVIFDAVRNDGQDQDAAYQCELSMTPKGKVLAMSCELVAG